MVQLLLKDFFVCLFFSYPKPHGPLQAQTEMHGEVGLEVILMPFCAQNHSALFQTNSYLTLTSLKEDSLQGGPCHSCVCLQEGAFH